MAPCLSCQVCAGIGHVCTSSLKRSHRNLSNSSELLTSGELGRFENHIGYVRNQPWQVGLLWMIVLAGRKIIWMERQSH